MRERLRVSKPVAESVENLDVGQDAHGPAPVQALLRGLSILRQFTLDTSELNLTELSNKTGLNRTTVYRFAKTLQREGYLAFDPSSRRYSVGPAWAIALQSLGTGVGLGQVLEPELEVLAQSAMEMVALGVQKGQRLYVIRSITSESVYSLIGPTDKEILTLGDTWNAGVKLHLAWSGNAMIRTVLGRPVARYTDQTITDPKALECILAQAREEGVAYEIEERRIGVCAVAAPIVVDARLVGNVALIAIRERFDSNKSRYTSLVREAAASMAARLGMTGE